MICKFCGNVIEDNSEYCFICGQKVVVETAPKATEPAEAVTAPAAAEAYTVPVATQAAPIVAPTAEDIKAAKKARKEAKKASKNEERAIRDALPELTKSDKFIYGALPVLILTLVALNQSLISIIIAAVFAIATAVLVYKFYKKCISKSFESKATQLLNTSLIGSCIGMVILAASLIFNYMLK